MESLPQKKIVVLGGSRGVGRVIVQTLNAGGAQVLAVARNADALTRRPLPRGTMIISISSGAAIGGSPISGGYAGAKRMQMFLANYAQKESDRLGLDLRFLAVTPMRPMVDTEGGRAAV